MIDRRAFTREFALLLQRFGRDANEIMTQRYYEYLSAHLTTDEFERAARVIYAEDTFWPSPKRFLDALDGDPRERAESAWATVMNAARNWPQEKPDVDPATARIVAGLGGWREIAFAESDAKLATLRKAFLSAFADEAQRERNERRLDAPDPLSLTRK